MVKRTILKWMWNRKLKKLKEDLNFEKGKNILFLLQGTTPVEMIRLTGIFHGVKGEYPDVKIGVVTNPKAKEFILNNPYVDKIYLYPHSWKEMREVLAHIEEDGYCSRVTLPNAVKLKERYPVPELYPMDHFIYRAQGYRGWLKGERMVLECVGEKTLIPRSEGIQDLIALISMADEVKTENPLIREIVAVFREDKIDKETK
jgi:hypothetical protein